MSDSFTVAALAELDRLYSSARRLCPNPQEAEDLAQEVYVEAFARRDALREIGAMRVWLHRILHGKFVDHLRRKQRTPTLVAIEELEDYDALALDASMATPDEAFFDRILPEEVEDALDRLPTDQRTVLILREIGELSYEEMSEACGAPVGTIRSRLARARRAMQSALAAYARERGILRKEAKKDG